MTQPTAIQERAVKYGGGVSGQRLFEKDVNQAQVVSMLLGYTAMPFEANPALFQSINAPPNAQNMLRQMLQRNPSARPALKDVRPHPPQLALCDCGLNVRMQLSCNVLKYALQCACVIAGVIACAHLRDMLRLVGPCLHTSCLVQPMSQLHAPTTSIWICCLYSRKSLQSLAPCSNALISVTCRYCQTAYLLVFQGRSAFNQKDSSPTTPGLECRFQEPNV